jgi:hypothetical protein
MTRFRFAAAALVVLGLTTADASADSIAPPSAPSLPAAAITDISAQSRERRRPRIIVPARRPRTQHDIFPRPEPYDWPGPGFVRDCVGWLEPEWRPSGTVIVPRRRCAWVPG